MISILKEKSLKLRGFSFIIIHLLSCILISGTATGTANSKEDGKKTTDVIQNFACPKKRKDLF